MLSAQIDRMERHNRPAPLLSDMRLPQPPPPRQHGRSEVGIRAALTCGECWPTDPFDDERDDKRERG